MRTHRVIASFRMPLFSAQDPCMCSACAECKKLAKRLERQDKLAEQQLAPAQPQRVAA